MKTNVGRSGSLPEAEQQKMRECMSTMALSTIYKSNHPYTRRLPQQINEAQELMMSKGITDAMVANGAIPKEITPDTVRMFLATPAAPEIALEKGMPREHVKNRIAQEELNAKTDLNPVPTEKKQDEFQRGLK